MWKTVMVLAGAALPMSLLWCSAGAVRPATGALGVLALTRSSAAAQPGPTSRPWAEMDYGPFKSGSLVVEPGNYANKGIAIRVDHGEGGVSQGSEFLLFETDTLRWAAGWVGPGFIDWNSITLNGRHQVDPALVGERVFVNPDAPGWGDREGSFTDTRFQGRGGRRFGPMDKKAFEWRGLYLHGDRIVLSYRVGDVDILELGGAEGDGELRALTRTLDLGPRLHDLVVQVAYQRSGRPQVARGGEKRGRMAVFREPRPMGASPRPAGHTAVAWTGGPEGTEWITTREGHLRLRIPRGEEPARLKILMASVPRPRRLRGFKALLERSQAPIELGRLLRGGGGRRWKRELRTELELVGGSEAPYVLESISVPLDNPYRSWMRLSGFDFFADGRRAAVSTWMGDVWIVEGLGGHSQTGEMEGPFTWKRIAAGLYEPLGLKIIDEQIYVTGRDQISRLKDLDGDGEIDFYESFNHDAQASEHYHEFAVGLEVDAEGNFYYAKCAGHDFEARVPQHGTLIRVSADGSESEIVASGFRAPNGLAINPDGKSFTLTDQEGHWTPKNKVNWVEPGKFYGYMMGWHDADQQPDGFAPPAVWIHNELDRSPSEPVWVSSDRWGLSRGSLLTLSYGTGKIFNVMLDETAGGQRQGAISRLPIAAAPTGLVRGRFHPVDGQLYVVGLFGWSSDKTQPGGFYRARYTGRPIHRPDGFQATEDGVEIAFSDPLDRSSAGDPGNYSARIWEYRREPSYGSKDYRVLGEGQGRDSLEVRSASVSADGRRVRLEIPQLRPVMQLHIDMNLRAADGTRLRGVYVHGTVHALRN